MPSALLVPCQASVHFAPAATTPGMAVTATSRAPCGCAAPRCCAAAAELDGQRESRRRDRRDDGIRHAGFYRLESESIDSQNRLPQQMAMAVLLIFRTMTEQRDMARPGEPADQAKGELLPVILDGRVARIDAVRPSEARLDIAAQTPAMIFVRPGPP